MARIRVSIVTDRDEMFSDEHAKGEIEVEINDPKANLVYITVKDKDNGFKVGAFECDRTELLNKLLEAK